MCGCTCVTIYSLHTHTPPIYSFYTHCVNVNVMNLYNAAHQYAEENTGSSLWSGSSGDILSSHTQGHYVSIDWLLLHPVVAQKNGGCQVKLCLISLTLNSNVWPCNIMVLLIKIPACLETPYSEMGPLIIWFSATLSISLANYGPIYSSTISTLEKHYSCFLI